MLYPFYLLKFREILIYFYCFSWVLSGLENVLLYDMQGYPTSDFDLLLQLHFPLHVLLLPPNNDYLEFHKDTKFHPSFLPPSLPPSFFFPSSFLLFFLSFFIFLSFLLPAFLSQNAFPQLSFLWELQLSNSSITVFLIIHFYSFWIPKYFICDYFSNTWSHLPHKTVRSLRIDSASISPHILWRMSYKTICLQEVRDGERKERKREIQEKIKEKNDTEKWKVTWRLLSIIFTKYSLYFFFFLSLNLSIGDLQCCVNFCYTAEWLHYEYRYTYFFHNLFHYGLLQGIEYSSLCYIVGLCYESIVVFKFI